jgi:phosphopantothenoylcysteine decarboxylase/phosphopantothenate--cysteine ligase
VIFEEALAALSKKDLAGENILVTAGPTREELDPVRYISNHSSGKMGYAIAGAARRRGARVMLVTGPTCLAEPYGVETVQVTTALDMRLAIMDRLEESTMVIKAAAVADYRPARRAALKIKKSAGSHTLELEKNPDILGELGEMKGKRLLVGFAAETDDLVGNAGKKLAEKNLDMVVANDISLEGAGFNVDTNIVKLLFRDGTVEDLPLMGKQALADIILDRVMGLKTGTEERG